MRLVFVISSLESGGAERVVSLLANYWSETYGWDVTVMTFVGPESPPFYRLSPSVKLQPLGISGQSLTWWAGLRNTINRVLKLRRAICQLAPERVVSFCDKTNCVVILAMIGSGIPVVISERSDPYSQRIGLFWNALRRITYPFSASLVLQTIGVSKYFAGWRLKNQIIIPNPISLERAEVIGARGNVVIAVGRLVAVKNFDLLIKAFARTRADYPEWLLEIHGEGPLRPHLEQVICKSDLTGAVRLPGRTSNIASQLMQAQIFVLSSRYEGFPNALCEAMASGLSVVATDCDHGPREIIRDKLDGILVPVNDVESLASVLRSLMGNRDLRASFSNKAEKSIKRFALPAISDRWRQHLESL